MFEDLIGNTQAKETLGRLIAAERIPNALLFSGVEGVGKKAFALEIAKAFVCRGPVGFSACGACHACTRVSAFTPPTSDKKDDYKQVFFTEHPDVGLVIPFNKNILVDAIRELEREAYFRPFEAPARVFIIEDADKMNDAASNALLKTLEEPASTSYIFLISSRPDSMLQTIHSRCQVIRFACLDAKEIEKYLLKTEKFSPVDAGLISRLCSGSIGRALSMDVEKFYAQREAMMRVLQSVITNEGRSALLQTAESMNDPKNKDAYETALETLQALIRDLWIVKIGGNSEEIVNFDLAARLEKLAALADTRLLARWIEEIELLRESLAVNINKKIATSSLFTQMAA
jgi:DNA polymerase-3 subunit delta'